MLRPALCLVVGAAAPVLGQSNAERIVNDRYSRSHDYDLLHERIEVGGFDWERHAFTGRVSLTLTALRPQFDSVILDAGRRLELREVEGPRGDPWQYRSSGDTLVVHLPKPAGFRDTVRFSVSYDGTVLNGKGLTFIEADSLPSPRPRQLWSQGEAQDNHLWFPTYDFPNDRSTWELLATVPAGFTAVSNGRLLHDRRNKDGSHTVHWAQEQPAPTYLISLVVAPLVKRTDRWQAVPVEYYVYPPDTGAVRRSFGLTPDAIGVYAGLTGVSYPWPKYAQTTVADFFGGEENVSAATVADWLPDSRAMADRPWYVWELVPHELAHQWFGDYVTTENWANTWLNEGFAEFMPGQYWRLRLGPRAAEDYYLNEYTRLLAVDRHRRMPLAALGSNLIYQKGALVLEMLRSYLGDERFWAAVHRYLTDHAFGTAVTDDLRRAILAATGENLDWFFDQWIYQAGFPDFAVSAAYDSIAAELRLVVRQTQLDTASGDSTGLRYSTPTVFQMPVTVRVGTADGDRIARARLSAREDTIVVRGVTSQPTMVVFDDGNTVLKRLSFQQPTPWLATQLAQDPNIWNRVWVIGQLAGRTRDSVARAALLRAAASADYFEIRAEALRALARFGPDSLIQAGAIRSCRDTSAAVRAAALELLGTIGGGEVVGRDAFEHDTSYAVQAAGLGTFFGADSWVRRDMIRRGLGARSYLGAVENAALDLILQTGDTLLVGPVDSLVSRLPRATLVLAGLANRGSGQALDALALRLEDTRGLVRQSALRAFQSVLRRDLALERLRAVQGSLRMEEVREAVGRLLMEWEGDKLTAPGSGDVVP